MNTNFVNIIKRIIAEQGDDILANPQRLKGYVADYAAAESKAERLVFSKCIEAGAYNELKDAPDAAARQAVKTALAQRVHSSEGLDLALCNDALDALEAGMIEVKPLCQKCGKELKEGWKMCPFCGEAQPASVPVPEAAPEVAVPEVPVTPSQETAAAVETPLVVETPPPMSTAAQTAAASPAAAQMQTKQTKSHASSAKKHIRRNILIAAGVVGVLVIGIGIWIWYQQQPNVTAADLPSLCEGWTVSNTQAEIYYSETTAKTNVNGEDIEYWLYNTYKNDGGSGERLLQIIFNELRNAGLVPYVNSAEHISPNTVLHKNVKKMMLNKIDSELHDVSVCLLEGSLIINNYDSSQKTFDTIIIPVEEISSDFAYIEGGTFTMGSPQSYRYHESNQIQHNATVSSFYIGKYELTQKEWKEVMGNNPSNFKGDDLPVERVNWYDAIEYCNKRSEQEGLAPAYTIDKIRSDPNNNAPTRGTAEWEHGDTMRWTVTWNRNANGYRLPTEAEWEYACRAGTTTLLSTENEINSAGWSTTTSGWRTHPVGQKQPNTWGLYDMYGNVWELCWDWYTEYLRDEQTNPIGPNFGSGRVRRGGSWLTYGLGICAALRRGITPASQDYRVGFRLVRNAE